MVDPETRILAPAFFAKEQLNKNRRLLSQTSTNFFLKFLYFFLGYLGSL